MICQVNDLGKVSHLLNYPFILLTVSSAMYNHFLFLLFILMESYKTQTKKNTVALMT